MGLVGTLEESAT